jgi:uncharacterized protein
VADDELSAPLGQNAKKKNTSRRFTLPVRISHIVAGALGLFVLAFAVWALAVDDPLGGEPIAVVATGFDSPRPGPALPAIVSGGTGGAGPAQLRRSRHSGAKVLADPGARRGAARSPRPQHQDRHDHRWLHRQTPGGPDHGVARHPRAA